MVRKLTQEEVQERITKNFVQNVVLISEYINKRSPVKLRCTDCGHEWTISARNIILDTKHYCPKCSTQKTGKYFKCAYCGKEVYRTLHEIKKNTSGYFYCSHTCGNRHKNQLRKNAGEWDAGISNYRVRAFENYEHKCIVCGWDEDPRILEVHHIDENRKNNIIDNLCILCPNCHRKITLGYYELTKDFELIPTSKK